MIVQYAAAAVACLMPGSWPVHTMDMSMADGSVPKRDAYGNPCSPESSTCQKSHWAGHVTGLDIDLGYYVTQNGDDPGAGCPYTTPTTVSCSSWQQCYNQGIGTICSGGKCHVNQNHCVGPPTLLDVTRFTLFVGKAFESPRVRCLGVDGLIAPAVIQEAQSLASQGLITSTALAKIKGGVLVYETQAPTPSNPGTGWYYSHWGHFHLSTIHDPYYADPPPPPFEPLPEAAPSPPSVDPSQLTIFHSTERLSRSALEAIPLLQLDPYEHESRPLPLQLRTWSPE